MQPQTYTVPQFLAAYNLSRSTLYRLWKEGCGPRTVRVGRRVLIPVDAAEAWINSLWKLDLSDHSTRSRKGSPT